MYIASESDQDGEPVEVEDYPSAHSRGKQLRYPISMTANEGNEKSDASASADSDDYASLNSSSDSSDVDLSSDEEEPTSSEQPQPQYIISGARARKRLRPDSGYVKEMSVYVRGCLLTTARDGKEIVLKDDDHLTFRKNLDENNVERVVIAEKTTTPPQTTTSSHMNGTKKTDSTEKSTKISSSKADKVKNESKPTEEKKVENTRAKSSRPRVEKKTKEIEKISPDSKLDVVKNESVTSDQHSSQEQKSVTVKVEDKMSPAEKSPLKQTSSLNSSVNGSLSRTEGRGEKRSHSDKDSCENCRQSESKKIMKFGKFGIVFDSSSPSSGSLRVLHKEAEELSKEGVSLKHEGNRQGQNGTLESLVSQGKYYLRASANFLKQALKLSEMKAVCKKTRDQDNASKWGERSVSTLAQTAALIESTTNIFSKAGSTRLVALSCKFSSIVLLTIYRLQHQKLYGLYSQTYAPGRSPDAAKTAGTPLNGSPGDNQDAIRSLIMREVGHMMRGFEQWRRYESFSAEVLPRIHDPSTTDFPTLFEDLTAELNK